ncbi:hypothetical protein L1887_23574 [Cichorium endivia]|nr:hypothetical protein L1887_23574 [Cichorium endivia]
MCLDGSGKYVDPVVDPIQLLDSGDPDVDFRDGDEEDFDTSFRIEGMASCSVPLDSVVVTNLNVIVLDLTLVVSGSLGHETASVGKKIITYVGDYMSIFDGVAAFHDKYVAAVIDLRNLLAARESGSPDMVAANSMFVEYGKHEGFLFNNKFNLGVPYESLQFYDSKQVGWVKEPYYDYMVVNFSALVLPVASMADLQAICHAFDDVAGPFRG